MASTDRLARRRGMTGSWPSGKAGKLKVDWRRARGSGVGMGLVSLVIGHWFVGSLVIGLLSVVQGGLSIVEGWGRGGLAGLAALVVEGGALGGGGLEGGFGGGF